MHLRVLENENDWTKQWYNMANGDSEQYETIKGMDVLEFWRIYRQYKERIEKINKTIEQENLKNRKR